MMSLIFCIGWKRRDAEWLESAGKCLAVWNTNMLICEQRLKGKCFSMHPPLLMFTSTESRLKGRLAGWLAGWLSPDGHVGSWLPDSPMDRPRGPRTDREQDEEEKINNDKPVHGEKQWWVSFQIWCLPFGEKKKRKWQLLSQNDGWCKRKANNKIFWRVAGK